MPMCAQIRTIPERCVPAREWRTELYPRRHTTAKFTYVQNPEKRKTHQLCVEYQKRHFIILHKLQAKNITNENHLHIHHSRDTRLPVFSARAASLFDSHTKYAVSSARLATTQDTIPDIVSSLASTLLCYYSLVCILRTYSACVLA